MKIEEGRKEMNETQMSEILEKFQSVTWSRPSEAVAGICIALRALGASEEDMHRLVCAATPSLGKVTGKIS